MYNNLVRNNLVDGLRTIVPDLARSVDVSDDGKTYTFNLRSGVKYHNGADFTSADVLATFNRIMDPPQGMISPLKAEFSFVEEITAPDAGTAVFHLSAPRSYFLNVLSATNAYVYSEASLQENDFDLRDVIVPGTGAFRFVEHQPAERWLLERNPDYWDAELPYIDQLELLHVPAWSDRGTAVLTGQADMSWNVAFETWQEGSARDDIDNKLLPNFGAYWLFMNNASGPLADARVRKAIHLGVSKQNLKAAFGTQEVINITRWVPQGDPYATSPADLASMPGYREDKTEDIAEAKRLLAEAGYGDGFPELEILAASGPQAELLAPAVQDMLNRDLGIPTKIRIIERASLGTEQQQGTYQLMVHTRGHGVSDISPRGNLWWRTGGSQNFGGYSEPRFDALLDQIDDETDVATRQGQINDAQDVLDDNPPEYLIGYTYHLPMWNSKVKGIELHDRIFAEWGRMETVWIDS
jgi:ABC-type transport system substrate-binding protein